MRVAAYCRVSKDTERLSHSFESQSSYYKGLIESNPEWEPAGVYGDFAVTGLRSERRDGFNSLVADCESGLIDVVFTKSVSRFARDTVDLLKTVRRLKELGVDVRFEKEDVSTLSAEGEVLITLLASFAQQESEAISENVKWGIRRKYEKGLPNGRPSVYGYRWVCGSLIVEPEEAEVVERIFDELCSGKSVRAIVRGLNGDGVPTKAGGPWNKNGIAYILENRAYIGELHLQKSFVADPVSGKKVRNTGQLPQYIVEGDHEPIVPHGVFERAQGILARKRELGWRANEGLNLTCLSGIVKCGVCGKSYVHGCTRPNRSCSMEGEGRIGYWACIEAKRVGESHGCHIRDDVLRDAAAKALGLDAFDEAAFSERVERITAHPDRRLEFEMADGSVASVTWEPVDRRGTWTEERRAAKAEEVRRHSAKGEGRYYPFTTRVRCASCGADFRHRVNVTKSRGRVGRWTHSGEVREGCVLHGLDDERLETICADALGHDRFDGATFMERVERIDVTEGMELRFRFKDGTIETSEYGKHGRARALPVETQGDDET